jgi:voltage-gated potassium channel Kch
MRAASDFRHQVEASVSSLKRVLMGLFFVAVGMSIDFKVVVELGPILVAIVAFVVAIKVVVMAVLGMGFGLGRAAGLRAAFLLSQCGEFGFVLFAVAHMGGLLTDHAFAVVLVVISISMALSPLLAKLGDWFADHFAGNVMIEGPLKESSEEMHDHVVVAGYGRSGRLMCMMLEGTDTPYIGFDLDLERIAGAKKEAHNVHFGDVADPEMQGAAAFARATAVVVTLEDMGAAGRLVDELRTFHPSLPIHMATPDLVTRDDMRARGVAEAVCAIVEGNLQLGGSVLSTAGVVQEDIDRLIEDFRRDDYALLRGVSAGTSNGRIG